MHMNSRVHDEVEWIGQKLDEIDSVASSFENSAAQMSGDAREWADRAIVRLRSARNRLAAFYWAAALNDTTDVADDASDEALMRLEKVELEILSCFFAVGCRAKAVKSAIAARTKMQRKAWQSSRDAIRLVASNAADHAGFEFDSGRRLSLESRKAREIVGRVSWASSRP
jgi:hypothetical protein